MLTGDRRRPARAVAKLRAGVHHSCSARRPRLLDPASPVGAAEGSATFGLTAGSTGGTTALAALDAAL